MRIHTSASNFEEMDGVVPNASPTAVVCAVLAVTGRSLPSNAALNIHCVMAWSGIACRAVRRQASPGPAKVTAAGADPGLGGSTLIAHVDPTHPDVSTSKAPAMHAANLKPSAKVSPSTRTANPGPARIAAGKDVAAVEPQTRPSPSPKLASPKNSPAAALTGSTSKPHQRELATTAAVPDDMVDGILHCECSSGSEVN